MTVAKKVVIIGDSHVEALGPRLMRLLPGVGLQPLGYTARRGWSEARYKAAGDVRAFARAHGVPDVVVFSLGGNNQNFNATTYRGTVETLLTAARRAGASQIVWVGPASGTPSVSAAAADAAARHQRTAELQATLMPTLGVHWVDSRPLTLGGNAPDGVHFTRTGYDTWATSLVHELAHGIAVAPMRGGSQGTGTIIVPVLILLVAAGVFGATVFLSGR